MPDAPVPVANIMTWFNPGDTLGPRPNSATDTPPTIQLTGYPGASFHTPLDPFDGKIEGDKQPNDAVIVPIFTDTTGMRCVLVWEDDVLNAHVIDNQSGLTMFWVRDDAITRHLEIVTPRLRAERFLQGTISGLIIDGPVPAPVENTERYGHGTPTTWGSDCPGSIKRSFCGTPC